MWRKVYSEKFTLATVATAHLCAHCLYRNIDDLLPMSTPSSSTPPPPTNSPTTSSGSPSVSIVVGVVIAVVLILLAPLAWFLIRRHRRIQATAQDSVKFSSGRREVTVDPAHLASRVTPFSVNGNGEPIGPQYNHRPGQGMRVAIRRDDGGWEFSGPSVENTPTTPFSHASMSNCPSPTASTFTSYSYATKDKSRPGDLTTRGYVELDADGLPPPAYNSDLPRPPDAFRSHV